PVVAMMRLKASKRCLASAFNGICGLAVAEVVRVPAPSAVPQTPVKSGAAAACADDDSASTTEVIAAVVENADRRVFMVSPLAGPQCIIRRRRGCARKIQMERL